MSSKADLRADLAELVLERTGEVVPSREERLRDALRGLLEAFADLRKGHSTAEQQHALREAWAALEDR